MLSFFLRLLFYFLMSSSVLIAAEVPEQTLNVTAAPEFQINLVSAIRPMVEENYIAIQIMVSIYLVMEFYLFPYLDQVAELAKEECSKQNYKKRYAENKRWRDEIRAQEQYERERERELEKSLFNDDYDYLSDYD